MTRMFLHEYTFTPMDKNENITPIVEIKVCIISEDREESSLLASGFVRDFFEQNMNVSHKLLIEGYKND